MNLHTPNLKSLLLSLAIVLTLMTIVSVPAHADSALFYIGPPTSPTPTLDGEAVIPYPGEFVSVSPGVAPSIFQYVCLDGSINTYWPQELSGNVYTFADQSSQDPNWTPAEQQAEEESAFLGSLLLYDANKLGVTLPSESYPYQDGTYTSTFVNNYAGPITFAIWQIMGTLPNGITPATTPAGTQAFVDFAQEVYHDYLTDPNNVLARNFLSSVSIFVPYPQGSNQRFMTAIPDSAFISSIPEPGTLGLLAAGALLAIIGRRRLRR